MNIRSMYPNNDFICEATFKLAQFINEPVEVNSSEEDYLFAPGLAPGDTNIDTWQVYKSWQVHVKEKLGFTSDFYALKQLYTTMVIRLYGIKLASAINGNTYTVVNEKHYKVLRDQRMVVAAQDVDIDIKREA